MCDYCIYIVCTDFHHLQSSSDRLLENQLETHQRKCHFLFNLRNNNVSFNLSLNNSKCRVRKIPQTAQKSIVNDRNIIKKRHDMKARQKHSKLQRRGKGGHGKRGRGCGRKSSKCRHTTHSTRAVAKAPKCK